MRLPRLYTQDVSLSLLFSKWESILNNLLSNPTNDSLLLKNVSLGVGETVVNHLLGRPLQGWSIVDINGSANIYRSAPLNDKTLTLTSSAAVIVTLEVF